MLRNSSIQRGWIGTHYLANLLAFLEKQERWHCADAEVARYIGNLVDVDLVEGGILILLRHSDMVKGGKDKYRTWTDDIDSCHATLDWTRTDNVNVSNATSDWKLDLLDNLWRNDLAWSTPGRVEVDDHKAIAGICQRLFVLVLTE